MNWADYQVGRRVVCIGVDSEIPAGVRLIGAPPVPEVGRVYTISKVAPGAWTGELAIGLAEFGDVIRFFLLHGDLCFGELLFKAKYFRPLDEGRLDQFRMMLVPAPKEGVPA